MSPTASDNRQIRLVTSTLTSTLTYDRFLNKTRSLGRLERSMVQLDGQQGEGPAGDLSLGGQRSDRPRSHKATLHDVAALVGVSPRTVSRVVNNEGGFSDATRQRVMDAISKLDYRPNLLARSLVTNRSNTLALIVPVIDDPFFPELAQGVQAAARQHGLTMYLAVSENQVDLEEEVLSRMASQAIDGAILFPATGSEEVALRFAGQGMPIVIIDRLIDHPYIACVHSNLEHGVALAVEHLATRGCKNLAMLSNSVLPGMGRREGAFRSHQGDGAVVIKAGATHDGGYRAMKQLMDEHPEVDGIFAYNDLVAVGAMEAAHEAGARVPQDYAIVGCDDIDMSARVSPGLTTIRLDREQLGTEAVARLVDLLANGPGAGLAAGSSQVTLPVSLVFRESA